jgi:hypothetical protein
MQIPAIAEQILGESLLCGEIWGFGANGDFLFALSGFFLVAATSILTATERVGATFRKRIIFLLWATEEVMATVRVGATFFLLGA